MIFLKLELMKKLCDNSIMNSSIVVGTLVDVLGSATLPLGASSFFFSIQLLSVSSSSLVIELIQVIDSLRTEMKLIVCLELLETRVSSFGML